LRYNFSVGKNPLSLSSVYSGKIESCLASGLDTSASYFWKLSAKDSIGDSSVITGMFFTPAQPDSDAGGVVSANDDSYMVQPNTLLAVSSVIGPLANDDNGGIGSLKAKRISEPSSGTIISFDSNSSFKYMPATDYTGNVTFWYCAYTATGVTDSAKITITIGGSNSAPYADAESYSTNEDVVLTVSAINGVLAGDSDPDGGALTAVLLQDVRHGLLAFNNDGSFIYTPELDYFGKDTLKYQARDPAGLTSAVISVVITITSVNDAPVAIPDTFTVKNNVILTVVAPGVMTNDTDADLNNLVTVKVTDPASGTITLNSNGSFTYTPVISYTGSVTFTYRVYDGTVYSTTVSDVINVTSP
jgi:hypothetical protein